MKNQVKKCLLGYIPDNERKRSQYCNPSECHKCGWNPQVASERKIRLRELGLLECSDGLLRLGGDLCNSVSELA